MRYVSKPQGANDPVAIRIRELIESTPPRAGRRSRIGHISIEDFAEAIGTTKARVIPWTKGRSYPDEKNRARLAAASGGRYSADDFIPPPESNQDDHLAELRAEVDELRRELDLSRVAQEALLRRVAGLEKAGRSQSRQSAQAKPKGGSK